MDLEVIEAVLLKWARQEPIIAKIHLFGSRLRGDHRLDSDIDIAVELDLSAAPGVDFSDGFATFSRYSEHWEAELAQRLPIPVDLEFYHGPEETPILHAGLERSGKLIYENFR
ncbi:nucleotidyltransferase domain-containing protein [Stenotrophomonas maltophilia]|uniref:nucleotidyltransferase domain-containing protein n=1 Tax=Stenotrophomonas maltophilia TaxID=40324 RepID=UPI0013DB1E10|nr:nucleotidyltransferase domain-containing protein [Stenotrophomonas maltophilia]MBN4977709.1 nucleotidyltransferase domain-containing protein [Stenotrophomonas maltophilia]NRP01109.1 nucleotidyltransferase domain-containing protein [Stenotrophomonas maltophilia]